MADCEKCTQESRIAALEKDSERNSSQHREFYDKFSVIAVREGISESNMQQLMSSINDIKSDLKDLKDAPSQSFNAVKMCIVTAIITAVVSGLAASIMNLIMK